jgi:hypothetical protein
MTKGTKSSVIVEKGTDFQEGAEISCCFFVMPDTMHFTARFSVTDEVQRI